jgi:hypothetical protein
MAKKKTRHVIRYHLSVYRGLEHLQPTFSYWVRKTLGDRRRGISSLSDVEYQEVKRKDRADILGRLVPQSYIDERCGRGFELSCSLISKDEPDEILFSLENWMGGSNYDGPLNRYREYLINHEFLHCSPFYLEHPDARDISMYCSKRVGKSAGPPVPVMYQQSRGLPKNCRYNSWPLPNEIFRKLA